MTKEMGLVLSGGGARGAYQVGVLSALQEIRESSGVPFKFEYLSGVSAGAINAASLAGQADNFKFAVENLRNLWMGLHFDQVFSTNSITMGKIGFRWLSDLSLGGFAGTTPGMSLMETSPLRKLIHKNMDYSKVRKNIEQGHLKALAITAIDYASSATTTFVQSQNEFASWDKGRKLSVPTAITTDHILASSAIPMLFPPIKVGDRFFGDGAVRNHAPCSPVIYLGAKKLLVIGVRLQGATAYDERALTNTMAPSVARVINTIMNSVMLDAIEQDIDRMRRLNDYAKAIPLESHEKIGLKPLDYFLISPSVDIGEMAVHKAHKLPRMVRFLLKGLGSLNDASELISYLLFESSFCTDLIEVGYKNGMNKKEELIELLLK